MTPNHMPKKSYDVGGGGPGIYPGTVASQANASRNVRAFPHSPISFNSDAAPSQLRQNNLHRKTVTNTNLVASANMNHLEVIAEDKRRVTNFAETSGEKARARKMPYSLKQLVDMQERIDMHTKSRVQAIMEGKSKAFNRSQSQMKKQPFEDSSNQQYDDGNFAEKFSRIKFRDYQDNTR